MVRHTIKQVFIKCSLKTSSSKWIENWLLTYISKWQCVYIYIFSFRYYAICHPLKARHIHTLKRAIVITVITWVTSFLLVSPQLLIQRLEPRLKMQPEMDPPIKLVMVCAEYFSDKRLDVAYTLFFYIVLYLAPLTIMFVAYGKIGHWLWVRKPIGNVTSNSAHSERHLLQRKRVIRMLMVILTLFTVCWSPFFTVQIYRLFIRSSSSSRLTVISLHLLGHSNCCINPIVYAFLQEKFQRSMYLTFCSFIKKQSTAIPRLTSHTEESVSKV